ncbi:hypothetical protein VA603_09380, partial [Stenotrophomonas sp. MH1]|nr:hypothetical protein [Stenotrophomonas sp. MH1]
GKDVDLQVALARRDGHWYLARTVAEADQVIAAAQAAEQARVEAAQAAATATDPATAPGSDRPDTAKTAAKP